MTCKRSMISFLMKIIVSTLMLMCLYIRWQSINGSNTNYKDRRWRSDHYFPNQRELFAAKNSRANSSAEYSSTEILNWLETMETRYEETNKHIKEVCQKYGIYNPTKPRLSQWLVDTNHHLAFCGNAKVGSTTWMHHFNALLPEGERPWGNGTGTLRDSIRFKILKRFHLWFSLNSERINSGNYFPELLKQDNITIFTFVRHPFERLVSAYNDKIKSKNVSFSNFAKRVIRAFDKQKMDGHWKPFLKNCHHCFVHYNIIGRMESFQEDVQYIIIKHKLENILPINNTLNFRSLNSKSLNKIDAKQASLEKFSQLTKTEIKKLYELYRLDFELFNYDLDIYLNA